jgi:hypothetical protein
MLLIVLVAALVFAARGGGAEPPAQLFVMAYDTTPGAVAETDVDLLLAAPASAVSVVVPAGYRFDATAPAGKVVGTAILRTATGASTTATLRADEPGMHAAVWAGGPLTVLVDAVSGGGFKLAFTPPAGTVDIDVDFDGLLTNPPGPGRVTWRALVTTGAGTVEARSAVGIPQTLGFSARFAGRLVLRGRLLSAGAPRRGVDVHLAIATNDDLSDARDVATARTRADGTYSFTRSFPRKPTAQRVTLIAYANFYVGACPGCVVQSTAPPPAAVVSLTVPKR